MHFTSVEGARTQTIDGRRLPVYFVILTVPAWVVSSLYGTPVADISLHVNRSLPSSPPFGTFVKGDGQDGRWVASSGFLPRCPQHRQFHSAWTYPRLRTLQVHSLESQIRASKPAHQRDVSLFSRVKSSMLTIFLSLDVEMSQQYTNVSTPRQHFNHVE